MIVVYTTHQKGEIARSKVLARAAEKGLVVSIPTTEARYDLVIDDGATLLRAQVKYADAVRSPGSIAVDLRRRSGSKLANTRKYTEDEIDLLLVYVPKIDKVLCFGKEHFVKPAFFIRFEPSVNNQRKKTSWAMDFLW